MPNKLVQVTSRLSNASPRAWFLAVVALAILVRLVLWMVYQPVSYSDTHSYQRSAGAIRAGWNDYDGTRTPGYPFFLVVVGADERVWLAQMALGVGITLVFFYLGWQMSGTPWFGGLAAMAHTLNLAQLFFEANLLTETLSTFWLMVTFSGALYWLWRPQRRTWWMAAGIGLTASLAVLTRPVFIFLPVWIGLFLLIASESGRRRLIWQLVMAFLIPVVLLVGGWAYFIQSRFGDWSLTTMNGYHLVQHSGVFFEYLPDDYAAIRDTYLKYRDEHIARYGTQANTIWGAIPELQEVSGQGFYDLSRTMARLSILLIREHPDLYLRNVALGWWLFWRAPAYWSAEALRWGWMAEPVRSLLLVQRFGLLAANLLFIVSTLLLAVSTKWRAALKANRAYWMLAGAVWLTSIMQTLLDHGDNPRFLVPLQSIVVFCMAWVAALSLAFWRARAIYSEPVKARYSKEKQGLSSD